VKYPSIPAYFYYQTEVKQEFYRQIQSLLRWRACKLDKYWVIIIDDIGYVKKSDGETSVLFEFIAHRYESGSLIVTSNQPFSQWDEIFPDALMTVAAVDRLILHAQIIGIGGKSYHKKQHLNPEKTAALNRPS